MMNRTSINQQVSKKGKGSKGCKAPGYKTKDHYADKPARKARLGRKP